MRKLKSYSNIWKVEKVLYSFNDFMLPFPVTFNQITWFVVMELVMINFGAFIPDNGIRYIGVPLLITWFMSKLTFDGKNPYNYLKTMLLYAARPKATYAVKTVKRCKRIVADNITIVRTVKCKDGEICSR